MNLSQFNMYELHYARMKNIVPNWDEALKNPKRYACKKPWLPKELTAKILDFGCGWGHQIMSLYVAGYRNIIGVEISPLQAKIANDAAAGRVQIINMDGKEYLSDKHNEFDLIIMNDVLEHIPYNDIIPLLKIVYNSLVNKGTIVIRVPNASSLLSSYSRYLDFTHLNGFTEYSLMQILDLSGFKDHHLIPDDISADWSAWSIFKPWRGLKIREKLNYIVHKILYFLRGQNPMPTVYGQNIEIYSRKYEDE